MSRGWRWRDKREWGMGAVGVMWVLLCVRVLEEAEFYNIGPLIRIIKTGWRKRITPSHRSGGSGAASMARAGRGWWGVGRREVRRDRTRFLGKAEAAL